jgi:hypothetical protein
VSSLQANQTTGRIRYDEPRRRVVGVPVAFFGVVLRDVPFDELTRPVFAVLVVFLAAPAFEAPRPLVAFEVLVFAVLVAFAVPASVVFFAPWPAAGFVFRCAGVVAGALAGALLSGTYAAAWARSFTI